MVRLSLGHSTGSSVDDILEDVDVLQSNQLVK